MTDKLSPKHEELLNLAREMIAKDGLNNFSLRGLARAKNWQAPSLYEYFGSLSELLVLLRRREDQALADALREARAPQANPRETVSHILRAYVDFFDKRPDRFDILFGAAKTKLTSVDGALPEGSAYQILRDAAADLAQAEGCAPDIAEDWAFTAWSYVHGACVLRAGFLDPLATQLPARMDTGIEIVLSGMGRDSALAAPSPLKPARNSRGSGEPA